MVQKWNGDWFPLPGQALFDRDKQQVAAASRDPRNLDLFVIRFENRTLHKAKRNQRLSEV
jgi:hypothetical protein